MLQTLSPSHFVFDAFILRHLINAYKVSKINLKSQLTLYKVKLLRKHYMESELWSLASRGLIPHQSVIKEIKNILSYNMICAA